jgi:hypothetical protein
MVTAPPRNITKRIDLPITHHILSPRSLIRGINFECSVSIEELRLLTAEFWADGELDRRGVSDGDGRGAAAGVELDMGRGFARGDGDL